MNYRYVDEELEYLFDNSDARAIVYHASFAPTLARIREPAAARSGSGSRWTTARARRCCPERSTTSRRSRRPSPRPPGRDLSPDDLYILYTGGTTGMPKGVLWRQEDILRAALYTGDPGSLEQMVERAKAGGIRSLPAPPFMHGAAHWVAFNMWHVGGTIVVQNQPRHLDPHDIWSTIEREKVNALTIVGDAFGRPLADQLRKRSYDLSSLKLLTSGGAILTAALKQEFLELIPDVRILDALGSSESGAQAMQFSVVGHAHQHGRFRAGARQRGAEGRSLGDRPGRLLRAGLAGAQRRGAARLLPGRGEDRQDVPGGGGRALLGPGRPRRPRREGPAAPVRARLGHHQLGRREDLRRGGRARPQASPVGVRRRGGGHAARPLGPAGDGAGPASRRRAASARPSSAQTASAHVAAYKLPKLFVFVDEIVRSPSGKADYRWAKATALARLTPSRT